MLLIIYGVLFFIRKTGVRSRTDESDSIAEIMGLKGGEALDIFKVSQFRMKDC
jgi:hypothetical protein